MHAADLALREALNPRLVAGDFCKTLAETGCSNVSSGLLLPESVLQMLHLDCDNKDANCGANTASWKMSNGFAQVPYNQSLLQLDELQMLAFDAEDAEVRADPTFCDAPNQELLLQTNIFRQIDAEAINFADALALQTVDVITLGEALFSSPGIDERLDAAAAALSAFCARAITKAPEKGKIEVQQKKKYPYRPCYGEEMFKPSAGGFWCFNAIKHINKKLSSKVFQQKLKRTSGAELLPEPLTKLTHDRTYAFFSQAGSRSNLHISRLPDLIDLAWFITYHGEPVRRRCTKQLKETIQGNHAALWKELRELLEEALGKCIERRSK